MASLIAQEMPHLSLTELAKKLNRDVAPVGRVGRRVRDRAIKDERVRRQVERLRREIEEWQKG